MKNFLKYINDYVKSCDWKDLTLLKLCTCAVGVMIGYYASKEKKNWLFIISAIIFVITFILIMTKFLKTCDSDTKEA